jgi:hypothetical protein
VKLCIYCTSKPMNDVGLRRHYALNACGLVPTGTVMPFDPDVGEDVWRKEAETIAREMGLLVAHCERLQGKGGRWLTSMPKGWPDTVFLSPRGGALVVEFKAHDGKPDPEQATWVNAWDRTLGVTGRVFWPPDWPTLYGMLTALA